MEKKPYNDKQNSLFDQIKLMKNCPQCKAEYTKEAFEIVEEGTHQELVTKPDGFYVKLSKMQIG